MIGAATCSEDEFRLIQDLKNNYDPIERPVRNHSEPIRVNLRIILQQLVDVLLPSKLNYLVFGREESSSNVGTLDPAYVE
ncbi:hypothetical protein OESDEN_00357 [Oesophagostomum dentatum]|uniref:Neurotransmitter-gated ion-channel ligand-binding domain-containing protein n=1 Tax=Oesophagostomum dentatum TaxID=61180 RepID=A0A0B1TW49_OESDE|nr:hypothetical protein OESDEN_00357 [Oesophagostomum dentatum]